MKTGPAKVVNTEKAYTLIEILIALTVLGILFGLGYAGFRDFSRRQSLQSVVRSIKADLRYAQENALSGQKPGSTITNYLLCQQPANVLNGYDFTIISSTSYNIRANCSPNGSPNPTKSVTIPNGFSISPTATTITFKTLGQGTSLTTDLVITITQTVTGSTQTITVSPGGGVQ